MKQGLGSEKEVWKYVCVQVSASDVRGCGVWLQNVMGLSLSPHVPVQETLVARQLITCFNLHLMAR